VEKKRSSAPATTRIGTEGQTPRIERKLLRALARRLVSMSGDPEV
jgi:hypothetical protein